MFTVYVGSILTTGLWLLSLKSSGEEPSWFIFAVSIWLWFTVLFANFAEAMAEGRGKAQADSLRAHGEKCRPRRYCAAHRAQRHDLVYRLDAGRRGNRCRSVRSAQRRFGGRRGRRLHSGRRRSRRRRGLGRRKRDHRRKRAGDSRERRRPQQRHRRHARAVRLAGRADHGQPGRDVSRSHDRDGRRGQAAENAQRNRLGHSAGRHDDRLLCWSA